MNHIDDKIKTINHVEGNIEGVDALCARLADAEKALADATVRRETSTEGHTVYAMRAARDATELAQMRERAERAEAKADVCGGEWCAQNRAEGRGPCGACSWCCAQQRERAELAEKALAKWRAAVNEPNN